MISEIRKVVKEDVQGFKEVLDSSELFPSEYLDDMIFDYLSNPESEEIWFTSLSNNNIIGLGYCTPKKFTDGTYNLLAIAVRKELQGKGIGRQMIGFIEQLLKEKSKRILIIETSSDPQYQLTREFYKNLNYRQEATIQDFWKEGENKVIFWKKLI